MEAFEDLMQSLEADRGLERDLESLPTSEEMAERRRAGRGMARPELAVVLAHAKLGLTDALLHSNLPESAYLERDLRGYFPPEVVERFGHLVPEHPLRRELIATLVANDVVNSQGITFVSRLSAETGAEPADIVRAYRIARDVGGAVDHWDQVEALAGRLEPALIDELLGGIDRLVETMARWYLAHARGQLGRAVEAHRDPFRAFVAAIPDSMSERRRQQRERAIWELADRGVPEEVARRHVDQPVQIHGPNVIQVSRATGTAIEQVTRAFFLVGEAFSVDELEDRLAGLTPSSRWQRWAVQGLQDELVAARRALAELLLRRADGADPGPVLEALIEERSQEVGRTSRFLRALAVDDVDAMAALTVAVRQVRATADEG
jgi:glutamate dehydrogenase